VPHVVRAGVKSHRQYSAVESVALFRCVQQTQGVGRMAAGGGIEAEEKPSDPEKGGSE